MPNQCFERYIRACKRCCKIFYADSKYSHICPGCDQRYDNLKEYRVEVGSIDHEKASKANFEPIEDEEDDE